MRTKRPIKDGMLGPMGSRTNTVQQYNKSENKWRKEMKALKNQNNMLYSIAKKSGSRREINKTKNIREKSSQKNSIYSSDDSDSDSSLASNIS